MVDISRLIKLLKDVRAFANLEQEQLETLYRFCTLRSIPRGEQAVRAGEPVYDLAVIATGRFVTQSQTTTETQEFGRGMVLEEKAFFTRTCALRTATALRESLLLVLTYDDLLDACRAYPALFEALLAAPYTTSPEPTIHKLKPERIVVCGGLAASRAALLLEFEALTEVRVLQASTYGAGLPGGISSREPEAAHWFQDQDLAFDLTVTPTDDNSDDTFTRSAVEQADEVLILDEGDTTNSVAAYAIQNRGMRNCHIIRSKDVKPSIHFATRTRYNVDFNAPREIATCCALTLGKAIAVAAVSSGAHGAAIFGALEALRESDIPFICLGAAGSAVLPAGLFGSGASSEAIAMVLQALAQPRVWERSSQPQALYKGSLVDRFLNTYLSPFDLTEMGTPFLSATRCLSNPQTIIHDTGSLRDQVRIGMAPPGVLPPVVTKNGVGFVSGEAHPAALVDAVDVLTPCPVVFLTTQTESLFKPAPPEAETVSRSSWFSPRVKREARRPTFSSPTAAMIAASTYPLPETRAQWTFTIPIPQGITIFDWVAWDQLRSAAYHWTAEQVTSLKPSLQKAMLPR